MTHRNVPGALPHAAFALASVCLAVAHASRTGFGAVVIESWLPLVLAAVILFAGWRFRRLEPTGNQVAITVALLCGGGLYGSGFVAFIQLIQAQNGATLVYPYYMVAMAGAGGVAMATVIAHYYVGYTQRMTEARDESARSRRLQKQASVLNRTLRHNLKNELQVIGGWLDVALGESDTDRKKGHRIVREHIADLQAASERARLIDSVLRTDRQTTVDIAACVENAASAIDGEVVVDGALPAEAPAVTHPEVQTAIEEALRNARQHNNTADLAVGASVSLVDGPERDPAWRVEIRDTGSGIPDVEIAALRGSAEGPLEHGRGLGLYLIQTIVEQSAGDLSIRRSESDDAGTTVSMTFPVADEMSVDAPTADIGTRGESATGAVLTGTEQPSLD